MPFDSRPYPEVVYEEAHTVLTLGQMMIEVMGDGKKWCRGYLHSHGRHCLLGALERIEPREPKRDALINRVYLHAVRFGHFKPDFNAPAARLMEFNDATSRRFRDLRALLIDCK